MKRGNSSAGAGGSEAGTPDERACIVNIVKRGNSLGGAMQKCKAGGTGFSGQFPSMRLS